MQSSLLQRRAAFGSVRPTAKRLVAVRSAAPASTSVSYKDAPLVPVTEKGEFSKFPSEPGVYAVFDASKTLQYIGLSRKIDVSVSGHFQELQELTQAIKYTTVSHATRESLTEAWKSWVEDAVAETGSIPPGNAPGETKWQSRSARPARPEIRLTNGKAINVDVKVLIEAVVKDNKVVAFIKGTRTQPQCGFSHRMMTTLNNSRAQYEVVNVLDEQYNPGLRDAIKDFSQWPTIPQLYVNGEFVGGADIVDELAGTGELQLMLRDEKK